MAITEFDDAQTRQMLLAVRDWLRSRQDDASGGYATLDADAADSLGSDLGLDKPSAHRLLIDLTDEGYLDAECHTSGSEVAPLRYAEVRGLTDLALERLP
jgi:hypothetical protein